MRAVRTSHNRTDACGFFLLLLPVSRLFLEREPTWQTPLGVTLGSEGGARQLGTRISSDRSVRCSRRTVCFSQAWNCLHGISLGVPDVIDSFVRSHEPDQIRVTYARSDGINHNFWRELGIIKTKNTTIITLTITSYFEEKQNTDPFDNTLWNAFRLLFHYFKWRVWEVGHRRHLSHASLPKLYTIVYKYRYIFLN